MSLRFFEGPAGSGKTTRLFQALAGILETRPLREHERVLALTKMHGSRRRMRGRLACLPGHRGRFECLTVDSFAWGLFRRWRSLARAKGISQTDETDFAEICRRAGALLAEETVQNWTSRAFPIVVVDEMQDSKGGQFDIVRTLSATVTCLAAGDDYQDLDASGESAAVAWAREHSEIVSLTNNHRTEAAGLLAAANALRCGGEVLQDGEGFRRLGARNHNVGASFVSKNLTWWHKCNDIAVITPVRAVSSAFVRNLVARVEEGPIGTPAVGPHRLSWEMAQEEECEQFLASLGLPDDPAVEVDASNIHLSEARGASNALGKWFERQRRVTGRVAFSGGEIRQQAQLIYQRSRAYRRVPERGVRAMTIHQAKNREFDSVIVLWPYEVGGSTERQRRLLYNAITRAKHRAVVVVQNPSRLNQPPFVPDNGS